MKLELLRKALPLMLVSGLGLVAGLVREMSIAYGFGATWSSDTYFVAMVPIVILMALGSDLGVAMVPLYIRRQSEQGQDDASRIFSNASRRVTAWAAVVIAAAALSAAWWIPLVAPGLPDSAQQEAVHLTWILAPAAALILPSMLWQAQASAHGRFSVPQMATLAPSLGVIAGALLLASSLGVMGLATGQTGGLFAQTFVLWLAARQPSARTAASATDAREMRTFFLTWALVVTGTLMSKLEPILQRYYGSGLGAGEISSLNYAQRISYLPNVLFTMALATVAFPRLSRLVLGDRPAFKRLLRTLLASSAAALGVIAAAVFLLREWIVALLLNHGQFTADDVSRTSLLVGYFSLTIVPTGLAIVLLRCILVLQGARHYAVGGVLSLLTWWLVAQALVPSLGSAALALATASGMSVLAAVLAAGVALELRRRDREQPVTLSAEAR